MSNSSIRIAAAATAIFLGALQPSSAIPILDRSVHTLWNSTPLQCQVGTTNANKKKLHMVVSAVYWRTYPDYRWEVRYTLVAEDHDKTGGGWHTVAALYAINANITVKNITAPVPMSAYLPVSGAVAGGVILSGVTQAPPVITPVDIKASRSGGSSGYRINWPNFSQTCQND